MAHNNARIAGRTGAGLTRAPGARMVKVSALGALSCAVAAAGLMIPADAAVRDGHSVFVLKNDSIVESEGLNPNENVTVEVRRNGVVVGSAAAQASPDGTIAVNHDSCWDNFTPSILPGDVVRVADSGGVADTVRVANIHTRGEPTLVGSTLTIQGTANGRPPVGQLMVEGRTNDPIRFRPLAPNPNPDADEVRGVIAYDRGTGGDFTATFTGLNADQQAAAQNLGEWLVAQGPNAREQTIATEGSPVPGPGCGQTAPAASHAVTDLSRAVINKANKSKNLRVGGMSIDATAVSVSLRDRDGTVVTRRANVSGDAGPQTWTAVFRPRALRRLNGRVRVVGTYTVDETELNGSTMSLLKDVRAPRRPSASPRGGTYTRRQAVSLNAAPGTRIRYTLGRRPPRPTRNRGLVYRGRQIRITATQTLKAVAIDKAGNVSRVRKQRYVIR